MCGQWRLPLAVLRMLVMCSCAVAATVLATAMGGGELRLVPVLRRAYETWAVAAASPETADPALTGAIAEKHAGPFAVSQHIRRVLMHGVLAIFRESLKAGSWVSGMFGSLQATTRVPAARQALAWEGGGDRTTVGTRCNVGGPGLVPGTVRVPRFRAAPVLERAHALGGRRLAGGGLPRGGEEAPVCWRGRQRGRHVGGERGRPPRLRHERGVLDEG